MTTTSSTLPKSFCFVLMPFSDDFKDVYQLGIKDACNNAGAYCERVDEQIFSERILDRIYNQIAKADLIVADMTGRNPNVFYEVGYAHALGKLTILLTRNADDIPFDFKHFPHIVYGNSISSLKDELEKRVRHFIVNPPTKPSEAKLDLQFFIEDQNLASGEAIWSTNSTFEPDFQLTVFNASSDTIVSGNFQLALITSHRLKTSRYSTDTVRLPNNTYLHMFPNFRALFPGIYVSCGMGFSCTPPLKIGEKITIILRVFTQQGIWDFPISLLCAGSDDIPF